ncbi:MAG: class I SAM-dependent methyltransferase [Acidobacteriota bacterium]
MNIHILINILIKPFRKKKMALFLEIFNPQPTDKILDVGGTIFNWKLINYKNDVVLLNLSEPEQSVDGEMKNISYVRGDALSLAYEDNSFDICFSNSVIEHVGDFKDQQLFAKEISRVGKKLWLQTPARSFFFEPHYLTPFIHWLPKNFQKKIMKNFTLRGLITRPSKNQVEDFVNDIRLLTFKEIKNLFPGCLIKKERFLFMTKAYYVIRR